MIRRNNKKGVIEAQFNWLFVLIVGAVILLFFMSLVNNQKKNSDLTVSSELLNHLDSIIKGASLSEGTVYDVSMPLSQALTSSCEDQALTFQGTKLQGIDLTRNVLFSPNNMLGTKIFTYSLYWNEPFTITPFLYLTTDSVLFFVVDSSKLGKIYSELPVNDDPDMIDEDGNIVSVLKYEVDMDILPDLLEADNEYYTHIKIITTETLPEHFFSSKTKAKILVYTIPEPPYDGYFTVNVTEYSRNGAINDARQAHILGFPSLLGMLFSDSVDEHNCNMQKAFLKYEIITKLQREKAQMLQEHVDNNPDFFSRKCGAGYYSNTTYNDMLEILENIEYDNLLALQNLEYPVTTLKQYNDILGDSSCPIPY